MLIALSLRRGGSRFDGTGGPYLYTRAAFGRFRGVRSRLDAVVHARRELGVGHQRAGRVARLLLAGVSRGGPARRAADHGHHRRDRRDQRPRHPAEQRRRQRPDDRASSCRSSIFIVAGLFAVDPSRLLGGPAPSAARALDDRRCC